MAKDGQIHLYLMKSHNRSTSQMFIKAPSLIPMKYTCRLTIGKCQNRRTIDENLFTTPGLVCARINPIVTLTSKQFNADPSLVSRNGLVRYIILTDGHLPPLLSILVQHSLTFQRIHTDLPPNLPKRTSLKHCIYPSKPVKRSVTFADQHQRTLLYSTSTWCPFAFRNYMLGSQNLPIWLAFDNQAVQCSREVLAVHFGTCPQVADLFGFSGSTKIWARDIIFRQNTRPILYIHQMLSPALEEHIGPMDLPNS